MAEKTKKLNEIGLSKGDYKGKRSTLCLGCGHNAIVAQMIAACYELNIPPERILKVSGIGCSSKSPTYFLGRSFGFNSLHGRMPAVATGRPDRHPRLIRCRALHFQAQIFVFGECFL